MDFKSFYRSMSKAERRAYANRVGRAEAYIDQQLIYGNASPTVKTILRLADESNGQLNDEDLAVWFVRQARVKCTN